MSKFRQLCHWLTDRGKRIHVSDFVPPTHPLRQWSDTFPWKGMVGAVEAHFARRFPQQHTGGQAAIPTRVLLGLELLKAETNCSDEAICSRLRTDFAVMYVCGLEDVQVDGSQAHFVLPETLSQFRSRMDEDLMAELVALQSGAVLDAGLVSTEHLVGDTFPVEQGSQRVTDATTLYKAKKSPPGRRPDNRFLDGRRAGSPARKRHPPTRAGQGNAYVWPPVPGQEQGVCQLGSIHRTAVTQGRGTAGSSRPFGTVVFAPARGTERAAESPSGYPTAGGGERPSTH